jgi:hypothetical protein
MERINMDINIELENITKDLFRNIKVMKELSVDKLDGLQLLYKQMRQMDRALKILEENGLVYSGTFIAEWLYNYKVVLLSMVCKIVDKITLSYLAGGTDRLILTLGKEKCLRASVLITYYYKSNLQLSSYGNAKPKESSLLSHLARLRTHATLAVNAVRDRSM